jgi:sugar phosphate isomerase/epimerase
MNTVPTLSPRAEAAAERFALRVTARLSSGTEDLPYDISERLRASRMQALAKRKKAFAPVLGAAPAVVHTGGGGAALGRGGSEGSGWWNALVSAVPLLALVVGLVMINIAQDESSVHDVAEVDAALLTDDLPPAAYADPGFVQFLKASAQASSN